MFNTFCSNLMANIPKVKQINHKISKLKDEKENI
jgi:hypothetical protein